MAATSVSAAILLDKMLFTLRNCPEGWRDYEPLATGKPAFGFYAKCWYNLMDPSRKGAHDSSSNIRLTGKHACMWLSNRGF